MARYKIIHDYNSDAFGPVKEGDEIDIEDSLIEWLLRDSPGVAVPVKAKRKRKAKPKKNRMVKAAQNRSVEHVMTSKNMPGLTKD